MAPSRVLAASLVVAFAIASLGAGLSAQEPDSPVDAAAPDFVREILPILERSCVDCHRAPWTDDRGRLRKPKGALRLDGKGYILTGGDGGPSVVPGKPARSPLYTRTILPPDDFDIMPEEGDPLSAEQTALLKRWISAGAPFGDWVGTGGPEGGGQDGRGTTAAVSVAEERMQRLARGLSAPSAAKLQAALGEHGRAEPLNEAGSLLRISWPAHRDQVDGKALDAVKELGRHVVELDLRGATKINDLRAVRRMTNLVRLDLSRTGIQSADLRALRDLEELCSLVLVGTRVDRSAHDSIAELPALQAVYLWKTGWKPAEMKKLRIARPQLRVVGAPQLPSGG